MEAYLLQRQWCKTCSTPSYFSWVILTETPIRTFWFSATETQQCIREEETARLIHSRLDNMRQISWASSNLLRRISTAMASSISCGSIPPILRLPSTQDWAGERFSRRQ